MKHLLIAAAIHITATLGVAAQQDIAYAYDNNGNRVGRTITLLKAIEDNSVQPGEDGLQKQDAAFYDSLDKTRIIIYPNPTEHSVTIETNGTQTETTYIQLLSPEGKVLDELEAENLKGQTFDLSRYSAGQYFIVLSNSNQKITWTIIKN